MALEVGAGDEVITVPYTWISSAEVIALLGAKRVFVDIRSDSWNMDEESTGVGYLGKHESNHACFNLWANSGHGFDKRSSVEGMEYL